MKVFVLHNDYPKKNLSANVNSNIYAMLAQNMQIHYKIIPQK